MARGIQCGSFLLFAAFALLLVSTISAPVFHDISFLNVSSGGRRLYFGVFGYSYRLNGGGNIGSSNRTVGYNLSEILAAFGNFTYRNDRLDNLTKALILHPIATGLTFISFLIALFSDRLGFIFAALVALLAFFVSLAAMAIDFAIFGIVRHAINDDSDIATAKFENAIWMTLAATVILFFSTFIVCFETCTARRRANTTRRDRETGYVSGGYVGNQGPMMAQTAPAPYKKQHFWNRNRY